MGLYEIEGLIPDMKNVSSVLHPRSSSGIPVPCTFNEVMHKKLGEPWVGDQLWRDPTAWVNHSPIYDFHVHEPLGFIWGLPIVVPTCPRKMFEQGPRKKYVDIVTDALHASSSDLITWNTLAMIRTQLHDHIPQQWLEIAAASLPTCEERECQEPFLSDNRRGYARISPIVLR